MTKRQERAAFNIEDTPQGILLTPIPAAIGRASISAAHRRALRWAHALWLRGVRAPILVRGARVRVLEA